MELAVRYEDISRAANGTLRMHLAAAPIIATSVVTKSAASGAWSAVPTWTNGVPTAGAIASIASGHVITFSQADRAVIGRDGVSTVLEVLAGGKLKCATGITASLLVGGYVSVNGSMIVNGTLDQLGLSFATVPVIRRIELEFDQIGATQFLQLATIWKRNTIIDFYRKQTDTTRVGRFWWLEGFDFSYDDRFGAYYKDIFSGRIVLEGK